MTLPVLPPDYAPGDVPLASEVNSILATARAAYAALAAVASGAPPGVRYEQTVAQPFTTSTNTKVTFDSAVETHADVTVSGTGNTDFLLNRIGKWRVSAGLRFLSGTTGERYLAINTGTTVTTLTTRKAHISVFGSTFACSLSLSTEFRIGSATSVHIAGYQSNGSTLNSDVAFGGSSHIALTWVGP